MDLHFETYGQGEPLIILHGLLGSLENWRSISARLAAHFKVIAVDQVGSSRVDLQACKLEYSIVSPK